MDRDQIDFSTLTADSLRIEFNEAYEATLKKVDELIEKSEAKSFNDVVVEIENTLESVIQKHVLINLLATLMGESFNDLAKSISPMFSDLMDKIFQNDVLYKKIEKIKDNESANLSIEDNQLLFKYYSKYIESGVHLSKEDRKRVATITKKISSLNLDFAQMVKSEIKNTRVVIDDEKELLGIDNSIVKQAKELAVIENEPDKWFFKIDPTTVQKVLESCESEKTRKTIRETFARRCCSGEFNTTLILEEIVKLRHERSILLGHETFADGTLKNRMLDKPEKVNDFVENLITNLRPLANEELYDIAKMLPKYENYQKGDLIDSWDFSFLANKLFNKRFNVDQKELKNYFSLENCFKGLFYHSEKLFSLTFKKIEASVYHEDVLVYQAIDMNSKEVLGNLYFDMFSRDNKNNGAYCGVFLKGRRKPTRKKPQVLIGLNLTKPLNNGPCLLSVAELRVLFHEFGHALHHLLSKSSYTSLSGTSVSRDFVEFPSTFMENFIYKKEGLDHFAFHYETGEKIPADMLKSVEESQSFRIATLMLFKSGLAQLDMSVFHNKDILSVKDWERFEKENTKSSQYFNRIPGEKRLCSFIHLFASGYAAGMYSYRYSDLLSTNAFRHFSKNGVINSELGMKFRESILEKGNSMKEMDCFLAFNKEEPKVSALIEKYRGLN